jgi:hypothetical protein
LAAVLPFFAVLLANAAGPRGPGQVQGVIHDPGRRLLDR